MMFASTRGGRRALVLAGIVVVLASACGPASDRGRGLETTQSTAKTLTVALQQEPAILVWDLAQSNVKSGGAHLSFNVLHNYLVIEDDQRRFRPQIAVEKPSVERGSWMVNADGSMDLTWQIRPNVRWHDGMPFTTDDLVFSFNVFKDPEIPNNIGRLVAPFESVTATDATTVVAHWSRTFVDADQAVGLLPLPKHLLGSVYDADKTGFVSSPRLSTDFVGLGPYRLVRWESGSHMELAPFEGYFLGRPPLSSVIVRFIGDENTLTANVLAGTVDVVPPLGLDIDATSEVKRRWEGTGNQATPQLRGGFRVLEMQHRPDYARPAIGLATYQVRQALYHAIDRQSLADTMSNGISPVADSWFSPSDPLRPEVEPWIPQFPFDPSRATTLLAQAGWSKGADGQLARPPIGERFDVQLTARGPRDAKEQHIIADNWKAVGASVDLYNIPPALQSDREHVSTLPGAWLATLQIEHLTTDRFHSRSITSAATRWTGNNRGGYSNLRVDSVLDRLTAAIAQRDRLNLYRELLVEEMGDLPLLMLYWEGDILLVVKGVKNVRGGGNSTWNVFDWDRE
jgi:peptide/nickel transport system substrate-binding protein